MATAAANTSSAQPESLSPPNFEFPRGHTRARSVSAGEEKSPQNFVFPRKAPSPNGTHFTRPRSGTTDAITLLAEIGVLPPPGTAAAARLRAPPTPYYPNRQRPQSMLALPTPPLPSVTLAPAPVGRANKRGTSDLPGTEQSTLAPSIPKEASTDEESAAQKPPHSAGPPPGYQRRGHAHRRSGAISSSDVWGLLSQSAPSLSLQNGAPTAKTIQPPTTPEIKPQTAVASQSKPNHVPRQSWSAPVSPAVGASAIPPHSPTPLDLDKKASKVAFTERVEIIPAPLSPDSALHAHGESMSSIGDFGSPLMRSPATPATPATPAPPGRPRSNTRNRSSSISSSQSPLSPELQAQFAHMTRPSTAGAILSPPITPVPPIPTEPVPTLRIDPVPATKVSTPIDVESPKSPTKSFTQEKPEKEKKTRKKSHKKALSDGSPQTASSSSLDFFDKSSENDDESSPKTKKGGKRKKKKQLKNFLFGKSVLGKHSKDGKIGRPLKRSPTPPSRHNSFRRQAEMELPPAWTESYVMMPEGYMAGRSLEELSSTMSPRYSGSGSDRDSPVIDLDAAMGPFNSPVVGNGMRSSGGFSAAKRRMHSSGAGGKMGIVSGVFNNSFVGTHRRSESMPEMGMPLFDLAEHAGMEMEDVFEEDEEDEESSSGSDTSSETDESEDGDMRRRMSTGGLGIGIQVTDGDGITTWEEGISVDWNNVPRGLRRSSLAPTLGSDGSLRNASIQEEEEPEDIPAAPQFSNIFAQNNDSRKSQASLSSPCSTPTSSVPSAQSSTSTVTPISAVSTSAYGLPSTPTTAASCLSESLSMALPSPPFAGPRTASPGSRRNSLTLKELVDLSLQENSGFDPYADTELSLLGEPGPEMRMSASADDVPSLTSSSSTMTSSYAAYCAAGMQQPSTPKTEEIPVAVVGSDGAQHLDVKGKPKGLKKKWSKVFKFWESDEKKEEKDGKDKNDKVVRKEEKTHKKEEKLQMKEKEKKEKKDKVKEGKQKNKEKI